MALFEGTAIIRLNMDLQAADQEAATEQLRSLIKSGMLYFPDYKLDEIEVIEVGDEA